MFRTITIDAVLNGFVIKAGCQTLVFNTAEELLRELDAYIKNLQETEELFLKASRYGMKGDGLIPTPRAYDQCAIDPPGYRGEPVGTTVAGPSYR